MLKDILKKLTIKDIIMLIVIAILAIMVIFRSPKEPDNSKLLNKIESLNEELIKNKAARKQARDSVIYWNNKYTIAIDNAEKNLADAEKAKLRSIYLEKELKADRKEIEEIKKKIDELESTENSKSSKDLLESLRKKLQE